MTEEQGGILLDVLVDIAVSLESCAMQLERLVEVVGEQDVPPDFLQPPLWVNEGGKN